MMRIIAGSAKGTKLKSLMEQTTRPSLGRIRENIFNMIQDKIAGSTCLDLYAGFGGFGIEALSRGALSCEFVESCPTACQIIGENLTKTKLMCEAKIFQRNVEQFLNQTKKSYDLIFADPPFYSTDYSFLIKEIFDQQLIKENGFLIIEKSINIKFKLPKESYVYRIKKYGKIEILILQSGGIHV